MTESDDPLDSYLLALGKFVHRYAEIENTMHQILRIVSDTNDRTAQVLFSGTRVSAAIEIIRRFYKARKQKLPNHLEKALCGIVEISKARNNLLHNGLNFENGIAIVTNETKKSVSQSSFKHIVAVSDIDALEADAMTINACLICFWIESRRPDLLNAESHKGWNEIALSPWRYKQPKPMRTRDRIRSTVRERKRPTLR
jgi:hypothetical protein